MDYTDEEYPFIRSITKNVYDLIKKIGSVILASTKFEALLKQKKLVL